ncbi:MAG: SurA N-terminal domain-containing protein [Bacteroidales bacterium]
MATLQKIRNKAGLLVVIIGLAMLAFIVGDFLNSGSTFFQMNKDKVAVINGKRITVEEFQSRVNKAVEEEQMRYRRDYNMSMPDGRSAQINKEIFDRMVSEQVLIDVTKQLGIDVSSAEMEDLLKGDNISQQVVQIFGNPQTGEVDKSRINSFLQHIFSDDQSQYTEEELRQVDEQRRFWLELEKSVKQERLMTKLFTVIQKSLTANDLDLQSSFEETNKNVDIIFAAQLYTAIPDSVVVVTDEELKAKYDAKKENFKQDGGREIKYFAINIAPSKADYKVTEDKINSFKEKFATTKDVAGLLSFNTDIPYTDAFVSVSKLDETVKGFASGAAVNDTYGPIFEKDAYKMYRLMSKSASPDSVKVRHIMLQADKSVLRDSLVDVIKNGGDFAALAKEYSLDTNSSSNGGDMGWMTETMAMQLGKDFIDACFRGTDKGAFKLTTNYGIHIVEVTDRTKPVEKVKVAQFVLGVRPSSETYSSLYNKVSQYIADNNKLETFQKGNTGKGIEIQTATLTPNDVNINNVNDARQVVKWAFSAEKGHLSEIFNVDNKFVVAMVSNEIEPGYASMAEIEPQLRAEIVNSKKGDIIIKALDSTAKDINLYAAKMSSRIDTARSVIFNNPVVSGLGFEPKVVGIAPYSEVGSLQGPVKGNRGVYVFNVIEKHPVISTFSKPNEVARYNQITQQMLYRQLLDVLKSKADVEDNRIKFF